jgi:hypothetical protein
MRGRFVPPVLASALPRSLLERFAGAGSAPLVTLLQCLASSAAGATLFEGRRRPAEDAR